MKSLQLAAGILILGAILVAVGTFSGSWAVMSDKSVDVRIGLRSAEICFEKCETHSLEEGTNHSTSDTVSVWAGKFTFGAGIATSLAAVVCGLIVLLQRSRHGAVVALGLAVASLIGALIFLVEMPSFSGLTRGFSGYFFLVGTAFVMTGGAIGLLAKKTQGQMATPTSVSAQAVPLLSASGPAPACPQCVAPTAWVEEHQRFFCSRCRVYV